MAYPSPIPVTRVWLTIGEAAALTGLSEYVLRDFVRKQKLEAWVPSPRATKVPLDALAAHMSPDVRATLPAELKGVEAKAAVSALLTQVAAPV